MVSLYIDKGIYYLTTSADVAILFMYIYVHTYIMFGPDPK